MNSRWIRYMIFVTQIVEIGSLSPLKRSTVIMKNTRILGDLIMSQEMLVNVWRFSKIIFTALHITNTVFREVVTLQIFFKLGSKLSASPGVLLLFRPPRVRSKHQRWLVIESITIDHCYDGICIRFARLQALCLHPKKEVTRPGGLLV